MSTPVFSEDPRHITSLETVEVDGGSLPPPYGTASLPLLPASPPPPRTSPAAVNSTSISISQPISISGSNNEISLSIPLESILHCVLNSTISSQTQQTKPWRTTRGIVIMLHCPVSIAGEGNTVNIEGEQEKIVHVPTPVVVHPLYNIAGAQYGSMQGPPEQQRIITPALAQPHQQHLRKRTSEDFDASIDVAPFTKRQHLADEHDEDEDKDGDRHAEDGDGDDAMVPHSTSGRSPNQSILDELRRVSS